MPRWRAGQPFPASVTAFSAPEPVAQPPATVAGRVTAVTSGAGLVVAAREVAPAIEAAAGLSEAVQVALIGGGVALAVALVIWGPDGLRRALDRWRNGDER